MGNLSVATGSQLFAAGTGLSWTGTTLNSVWDDNANGIHNVSGNVGIGTTTPESILQVETETAGFQIPMVVRNSAPNNLGTTVGIGLVNEQVDYSNFYKAAMVHERTGNFGIGKLHFLVDGAADGGVPTLAEARITILPNGNVGIGEPNPNVKFQVAGDATISGKFNSNGILESSDKRFKKNIESIKDALAKVLQIDGVTYNWRVDEFPSRNFTETTEIGVIAQDLEDVFPQLVTTDSEGYKSVQYSHLVPILIEAIKEQNTVISGLEEKVAKLNSKSEQGRSELSARLNELESLIIQYGLD